MAERSTSSGNKLKASRTLDPDTSLEGNLIQAAGAGACVVEPEKDHPELQQVEKENENKEENESSLQESTDVDGSLEDEDQEDEEDDDDEDTEDHIRYMESNAPIGNTGKSVDPNELQIEGLLTQEDYEDYKILENFLYFYDQYPSCKETFKEVLRYILEESQIYCWFLMVHECYNKLMKEQLAKPRDICRRLSSLETISKVQMKIIDDAKKEIHKVKLEVVETIDKLVTRLDGHFDNLSPTLNQKYKFVHYMTSKADLQRYVAECESGEERIRLGEEAGITYQEAEDGFSKIPGHQKNPYFLSNRLNYAVLKVDVMKDYDSGIKMVRSPFNMVFNNVSNRELLNDNFICSILELLRNNGHAWTLQKMELEGRTPTENNNITNAEGNSATTLPDTKALETDHLAEPVDAE